ncbi:MAG: segregation and condensation protein A [Gammaproteobacteria bacterium]
MSGSYFTGEGLGQARPLTASGSQSPIQTELPVARVGGVPLNEIPHDLYIPPHALEVILESFEGPLDLLLYLIKRQNVNILEIPMAEITRQYMHYIELMEKLRLELAAEYLLMAAMLAEIKSRMLLPRAVDLREEESDPRAELVRRLLEYERFKAAADRLDAIPRQGRDVHAVVVEFPGRVAPRWEAQISLGEVVEALMGVLDRAELFAHHHVQREELSVRERMGIVLECAADDRFIPFSAVFSIHEGRAGVVVSLLALLELLREALVELVQTEPFGPIYLRVSE